MTNEVEKKVHVKTIQTVGVGGSRRGLWGGLGGFKKGTHVHIVQFLKKGTHGTTLVHAKVHTKVYTRVQEYLQKGLTRLGTHKGCGGFTGFADCRRPLQLGTLYRVEKRSLLGILGSCGGWLGEVLEGSWGGLGGSWSGLGGSWGGLG